MCITIRDQVKAAIIGTMAEAEKAGRCPLAAAEAAYPGVPMVVLGACYGEMVSDQEDAWWKAIERAIDAETINRAVTAASAR
ncbi:MULTISPECIES: hypothetical protein [unclassified Methylobacterium]|uniref:hypothetical protein n=1 Tax=unclassified Methylobacterium TaxID=2615210 RepID=UPI002269D5EE|nr:MULTISPECIES: hypothetical protein [unclassified Methylobacterium]